MHVVIVAQLASQVILKKIDEEIISVVKLSYPLINSTSWGCNSSSLILCILLAMASTDLTTMLKFVCSRLIDVRVESILWDSAPRLSKCLNRLHFFS